MNTIDLFCGAGGITEGFRQAGFECLFANDFNPAAIETFRLNHPGVEANCSPIENLDPDQIRNQLGVRRGDLGCLVGGPPCQGFSIYAPDRWLHDPRNALFRHYLRFVDAFAPKTLVIENVPGMLSLDDGKVAEAIVEELTTRGYHVEVKILLAAHFGVPQNRWRLIFLASQQQGLGYPIPTFAAECRANFRGSSTHLQRQTPLEAWSLKDARTIKDAISDLPSLLSGAGGPEQPYPSFPSAKLSEYAREMRQSSSSVFNHVANRLAPINLKRLEFIKPGGAWTDIPHELLPSGMKKAKRGDHTKRYGRLRWEDRATTMLTKCDPHWGAVFHPDQPRTFTVREAARIQSFPDRYRFLGSRVAQYEQVGNAVPVLLAKALAEEIGRFLTQQTENALTNC